MTNYKIDKVKSVQILDKNTLEPIANLDGIANITTEVESSSLGDEVLSFNHSASFQGECNYDATINKIYNMILGKTNLNIPAYIECYLPILIQARWHKKPRINKKWLKRYGMKKDEVLVRYDVKTIGSQRSNNPDDDDFDLITTDIECNNMQYKFRQDQLRRNLKIEMCYK